MTNGYRCELGGGQEIIIENQGNQTLVTQASRATGQQQSQQSGFSTGAWEMPPALFRISTGLILRVEGSEGQFFFGLQGQYVGLLNTPPPLTNAEVLSLHQILDRGGASRIQPMEPMRPMEPMKPMEMRMGAMQMQMHSGMAEPEGEESRFCGQCGHAAAPADRFCTRCGHRLS